MNYFFFRPQLHCEYELDIDVRIVSLLSDGDPSIYEAQWIKREDEGPIILIEKKEEPSEYEKLIYSTFKKHPHIVRTYGFVGNDRRSVMILQEQAPHGNLQYLLESGQFQPSARVLVEIFSQIINAMINIVKNGLVHGDLRCENILVFQMHPTDPKRNLVKLANFALAHPNDRSYVDDRRLNIPVRYCALEILRSAGRSNYSELSDVYSMGVLMWQAYSKGKRPYDSSGTNGEVRQRKLKGEKLPRPLLCHKLVWEIIEGCWYNEPVLRFIFGDMKIRFNNIGQQ
jgi:serine/threonine protein kinase